MNRQELKMIGKQALRANYWLSVLVAFLLTIIGGSSVLSVRFNTNPNVTSAPQSVDPQTAKTVLSFLLPVLGIVTVIALLLHIFLFNPLKVGSYSFFRKNVDNENPDLGELSGGFRDYGHTFITLLLMEVFVFLWSLLLIIPGLMKAYSYRLVPYLLADEPDLTATATLKKSEDMMRGHRWEAFVLDLSFIGWHLLGAITFGLVEVFWTAPYYENTCAALYTDLKQNFQE